MKYFQYSIPNSQVTLYPLVCWHIGAKQSSTAFIEYVIQQVNADPTAFAIYMGDGGECVTKQSKGSIYEQSLSPGDQLRVCAEMLGRMGKKLKFGIRGNHGNRIDKETGVGWDEMLCARVGIPYYGVSAFGDIILRTGSPGKGGQLVGVSVYTNHGSSSGISPAGKMSAGHKPSTLVLADVALTAHTHACGECWPVKHWFYTEPASQRLCHHIMRQFVCGSGYDSRSGYAEEKMYPVIMPQHIAVNVKVSQNRATGEVQKTITHRTIDGFGDEFVPTEQAAKWATPPVELLAEAA